MKRIISILLGAAVLTALVVVGTLAQTGVTLKPVLQTTTTTYKTGEAFAEGVNVWHNGVNRGTVPVRVVVVFAGEDGKPVLVRP